MKVALVTGGGSGIGAVTAHRLVSQGWRVAVAGRRVEALEAVASRDERIHAFPADLADPAQATGLVERVTAELGRLDGLVSNAGVMAVGSIADTSPQDWQRILDVNVSATFHLVRAAMPDLRAAKGSIVVVGSIAALRNGEGAAAYSVSKAAVAMLARTIAVDEASHGVRANVVHPGWVRTEMADEEMAQFGEPLGLDVDAAYDAVTALVPQGRPGDPIEIANAIAWLLGPESSYVNGAELVVDGGTTIVDPGTVAFGHAITPRQ